VAAKTGTTNDSRDFWTIGYTPNIVVGAWAGNNDNSIAVKEIAGYVVAPMWHEIMSKVLVLRPQEFFGEPRSIPDDAPPALRGIYSSAAGIHDILYWVHKDDPLHGTPSSSDSQFPYWEYSIQHSY
jgi:membrane carboxypeptidase/penicillin-binding protein